MNNIGPGYNNNFNYYPPGGRGYNTNPSGGRGRGSNNNFRYSTGGRGRGSNNNFSHYSSGGRGRGSINDSSPPAGGRGSSYPAVGLGSNNGSSYPAGGRGRGSNIDSSHAASGRGRGSINDSNHPAGGRGRGSNNDSSHPDVGQDSKNDHEYKAGGPSLNDHGYTASGPGLKTPSDPGSNNNNPTAAGGNISSAQETIDQNRVDAELAYRKAKRAEQFPVSLNTPENFQALINLRKEGGFLKKDKEPSVASPPPNKPTIKESPAPTPVKKTNGLNFPNTAPNFLAFMDSNKKKDLPKVDAEPSVASPLPPNKTTINQSPAPTSLKKTMGLNFPIANDSLFLLGALNSFTPKPEDLDKLLKNEKEAILKMNIETGTTDLNKLTIEFHEDSKADTDLFNNILDNNTLRAINQITKQDPTFCAYEGSPLKGNYWRCLTALKGNQLDANRVGIGWTSKVIYCGETPLASPGNFWLISKEAGIKTVFDLTQPAERQIYYPIPHWPNDSLSYSWGTIKVENEGKPENAIWTTDVNEDGTKTYSLEFYPEMEFENVINKCYKYKVHSTSLDSNITTMYIYPFHNWRDGMFISVKELSRIVEDAKKAAKLGPIFIHCRAGLGRTGTLATAIIMEELISNGTFKQETFRQDLMRLAIALRLHRCDRFILTRLQLVLLENYGQSLFAAQKKA